MGLGAALADPELGVVLLHHLAEDVTDPQQVGVAAGPAQPRLKP
jgi:hypothetical protein